MASQDFVYDLREKLEEEKIEFAICIIRHGIKESKVDMHLNLLSDESAELICSAFDSLCNETEDEDIEIDFENE